MNMFDQPILRGKGPPSDPYTDHAALDDHDALTCTIIQAVAAVSRTDPVDLPLLYEAIDPDALVVVLRSMDVTGPGAVCFKYHGYLVTADPTGEIAVHPRPDVLIDVNVGGTVAGASVREAVQSAVAPDQVDARLDDHIDVGALTDLVAGAAYCQVRFAHAGSDVTVHGGGQVTLQPLSDERPAPSR